MNQLADSRFRARRVKEIIAEKAQKKQQAEEAAEAALAKARAPPPPTQLQSPQQPDYMTLRGTEEKLLKHENAISSTSRSTSKHGRTYKHLGSDTMPPDLSYAAQRATAVHGPLDTSGLARLLSGIDMGYYAKGLQDLGTYMFVFPFAILFASHSGAQVLWIRLINRQF